MLTGQLYTLFEEMSFHLCLFLYRLGCVFFVVLEIRNSSYSRILFGILYFMLYSYILL